MSMFRVWVRPIRGASRVRVDGFENARWLLARLSQSFIFKGSEPIFEERGTAICSFRVPHTSQVSGSAFLQGPRPRAGTPFGI
ncbi:MAG: hypothetical protein HYS13_23150 [Planctomycetia bacterium]|nr:hypothetical protein [Planctomycetia bacterium]